MFGKSRQAHYKRIHRNNELALQQAIIIKLVAEIRVKMPKLGGRKLYFKLRQPMLDHEIDIGRDKFFDVLSAFGYLVRRKKRRKPITTDSNHPFYKYPNLVKEIEAAYPNHVWVSDITYIALTHKFAYLSLITDVYSHKIVGYCLWRNLEAEGSLNALRMALSHRKTKHPLIHHSDRGLQYCCREYTKTLSENLVSISMTENGDPYENAVAERLNGILKAEFDLDRRFRTYEEALECVDRAVEIYNNERPHLSCEYLTPNQAFEKTHRLKKTWKRDVQLEPA